MGLGVPHNDEVVAVTRERLQAGGAVFLENTNTPQSASRFLRAVSISSRASASE